MSPTVGAPALLWNDGATIVAIVDGKYAVIRGDAGHAQVPLDRLCWDGAMRRWHITAPRPEPRQTQTPAEETVERDAARTLAPVDFIDHRPDARWDTE